MGQLGRIAFGFAGDGFDSQLIDCLLYTSRCVSETGLWPYNVYTIPAEADL